MKLVRLDGDTDWDASLPHGSFGESEATILYDFLQKGGIHLAVNILSKEGARKIVE